ncbi:nucleic acid-binding protein [Pseudanabaena phage Pam4]|nr:nucleic acid-binding protein [Pseudanabaena phage Pam4]
MDGRLEPSARYTRGPVLDPETVAALIASQVADPVALDGSSRPATGRCYSCDRPVTGERRFCGPCAAERNRW